MNKPPAAAEVLFGASGCVPPYTRFETVNGGGAITEGMSAPGGGKGKVLIASRSEHKLKMAEEEISPHGLDSGGVVQMACLDNTKADEVQAFFEALDGGYDALVVSAADKALHGPFLELQPSEVQNFFQSKYWGAYYCAHYGAKVLNPGGSITLFSGVLNRRPGRNCSPLAAVNGAIEGLTRSLALELGPDLRVNCFSPGFMDTERFDVIRPCLPPPNSALTDSQCRPPLS